MMAMTDKIPNLIRLAHIICGGFFICQAVPVLHTEFGALCAQVLALE